MFIRNAYNWFFSQPAQLTIPPTPKEDNIVIAPVKEVEKDLEKKMAELRVVQDKFLQHIEMIHREAKTTSLTPSSPSFNESKKPLVEPKKLPGTHPTERKIEDYILQAKGVIEREEYRLKKEAKTHEDYLQNCAAGLEIQRALYVMIVEIYDTLFHEMHKLNSLPERIENTLDLAAGATGHKALVLEVLLNMVKLTNLLFKKPAETVDSRLFLQIEGGLRHAILFLNDIFRELHVLLDQLEVRYPLSGAKLDESMTLKLFTPPQKVATRDIGTQTESLSPAL